MTLPKGWEARELRDCLAQLRTGPFGSSVHKSDYVVGGTPLINPMHIVAGSIRPSSGVTLGEVKARQLSEFRIAAGDVILGRRGEMGRCAVVSEKEAGWLIGTGSMALTPTKAITPEYLQMFLSSDAVVTALEGDAVGSTMVNLNQSILLNLGIFLPPAAEQHRIVAKLDALTARLARARAELNRVAVLAGRLRINVLRDVFGLSGAELPQGWALKRIDEIGDVQLGRQRSPKDHHGPDMRPYVRSANITWQGWDLSDVKEMNFSPDEFDTFQLLRGDVLLNEGSGSAKEVGKPAIWNGEIEGVCFQNTLLRVRPHAYSAELLRYAFLYLALSGQFIANTKGVNIIHIGKAGLAKTMLPVPPQDEQADILAKFDAAFARADRLEAEAACARALLDRLEAAILAKAFRGELVPQDPDDEPAGVLLDRIRAQRAAAPAKPRRRAVRTV